MSELQAARIIRERTCFDRVPYLSWKDKVDYLAFRWYDESASLPLKHIFEPGMYIREISIPADSYFIGRDHKLGHPCELVSGKIVLITERERKVLEAPYSLCTVPGYQMVLYAITDVVGRTYHVNPDDCRDIAALEARIFAPVATTLERGRRVLERVPTLQQADIQGFLA